MILKIAFQAGAEGAEVWKDWALPTVASVAQASGQASDPIEGIWIGELDYLAPRAYVSTPFWGTTADPALRRVLELVVIDPETDVAAALKAAVEEAQQAVEDQQ